MSTRDTVQSPSAWIFHPIVKNFGRFASENLRRNKDVPFQNTPCACARGL
jgi:hypothetical protein